MATIEDIKTLVKNTPNDMELGEQVRKLILKIEKNETRRHGLP